MLESVVVWFGGVGCYMLGLGVVVCNCGLKLRTLMFYVGVSQCSHEVEKLDVLC